MPVRPGPLGHIDLDESEDAPPISQQLVSALMANSGKVIDLFASWDADQSGTVSRREFHRAMKALGLDVKAPHIDEIFSAWDRDQSGMITLDELRWAGERNRTQRRRLTRRRETRYSGGRPIRAKAVDGKV